MHRIDGPGATVDNKFTDGDPVGGVPATVVTDDWLNDIQENLIALLVAAGITPTKGRAGDVLDSIRALNVIQMPFRNMAIYRIVGGVQSVSINGGAFTTTGATSFVYPASGVVRKRVWGAGGGGGGTSGASAAASGGNGGGYAEGIYKAASGTIDTVTVGAGGAGGVGASAGSTGGTSSAGASVTATGGGGGVGTNAGTVAGNTATFGIGSGGHFNFTGGSASGSFQASGYIASGGGGGFGSPPSPNAAGSAGGNGIFPGGAAAGGSAASAGGKGADGCVIYEY